MTVKVNLLKNSIPVEIGDLKLEFDLSDENIKRVLTMANEMKTKFDDVKDIETFKPAVKTAWDEAFGTGVFDKVYPIAGNSTSNAFLYFLEALDGILQEYNDQKESKVLKKYLNA